MAKTPFDDYLKEITFQREVWARKPVLKTVYHRWYRRIVNVLSSRTPVVEIGSGSGNFKEFYPACTATDVFISGPWIDAVVDAQELQFSPGEVGNFVVFDVLHHLQRPLEFLRRASAALQPGGRLILCEPAVTPWSRLIYGRAHHEELNMNWDLFAHDGTPPSPDPGHTFANIAIPEILFWRERARTLKALPDLSLKSAEKMSFLLYPLTGGFSYPSRVPHFGLSTMLSIEDIITIPFANWLTGMRMLVVLEKIPS